MSSSCNTNYCNILSQLRLNKLNVENKYFEIQLVKHQPKESPKLEVRWVESRGGKIGKL